MKKRTVFAVAVGLGAACAVLLAARLGLFAPSLARIKGTPIEETPLVDLAGHPHTFRELRGRPATLYLWATWCGPCLQHLARFGKTGPPNVPGRFLPVALDDDVAAVAAALRRTGYGGPAWVATDGMTLIQQRFAGNDRRAVPYVVELDAEGNIVAARYSD
jgi:thiol-disulfide isomerase/thioredoxin